jgi:hypothetical protein
MSEKKNIIIRVSEWERNRFLSLCKDKGLSVQRVIGEFVADIISNPDLLQKYIKK